MTENTNRDNLHKEFVSELKKFSTWLDEEIAAIEEMSRDQISNKGMKHRIQAALRQAAINGITLKLDKLATLNRMHRTIC